MRKLITVVVLLSSLFFYGCKDEKGNANQLFHGNWKGQSYSTTVKTASEQIIRAGNEITKATEYTFDKNGTFTEKVATFESKGNWEYNKDSSSLLLKYTKKEGPQDRKENTYTVKTINDSLMVLQFKLQNFGEELYTFKKQK